MGHLSAPVSSRDCILDLDGSKSASDGVVQTLVVLKGKQRYLIAATRADSRDL
jgi:hypothetical protein